MINELMELVKQISAERSDSHFTLFSFGSGWKAMFATPDLDGGHGRQEVGKLKAFKTPEEAIIHALCVFVVGGE